MVVAILMKNQDSVGGQEGVGMCQDALCPWVGGCHAPNDASFLPINYKAIAGTMRIPTVFFNYLFI